MFFSNAKYRSTTVLATQDYQWNFVILDKQSDDSVWLWELQRHKAYIISSRLKENWLLILLSSWSLSCTGHHWSNKKSFHFFQGMRAPVGHHSHIMISCNQLDLLWTIFWEPCKYKSNEPSEAVNLDKQKVLIVRESLWY